MHGRSRSLSHGLILVLVMALGGAALLGAHGVLLKGVSAPMALSVAGLGVVVVLAVALHLGVIGVVLTRLRRPVRPKDE